MSNPRINCMLFGACFAASTALASVAFAADADDNRPGATASTNEAHDSAHSQSIENSNGRAARDSDRGLDRARDRMSEEGVEHSHAQARDTDTDSRLASRDRDGDRDSEQDRK